MFYSRNEILRLWAHRCIQDPRLSLDGARIRGPLRSRATTEAANALSRVVRVEDWGGTLGDDAVAACQLAEEISP